jgi:prolyl oligopeptidase
MRRFPWTLALLALGLATGGLAPRAGAKEEKNMKWKYPSAKKADVVDEYHGTRVADPYRWLEDPDSPETVAWVEAENQITRGFIDAVPARARIERRLRKLWNYPRYALPRREGDRFFFSKNDGLQNQDVLYWTEGLGGEPRKLLDPNELSPDGTVALNTAAFSRDGRLMAYGLARSGSDWEELQIREVESGKDHKEKLQWTKFPGVAWKPDGAGFWYNRFPSPGTVPAEDQNNYSRVYWHQLGTPQEQDKLVFEMPEKKEWGFSPGITEDGRYLFLYVYHGTDDRNGFYYRDAGAESDFVRLLAPGEARFSPIGNVGSTFYFNTNLDAPRGRVIAIDFRNPTRSNWKEIIPEQADVVSSVLLVNEHFVVQTLRNAHELLKLYDLSGRFVRSVELPALGALAGVSGRQQDSEFFYAFTSFVYPTTIFRYDFKTEKSVVFRSSEIDFDASGYVTRQVFFPSKDGTKVSMFLTHRKTITYDGNNPVLLYGYGGFNIPVLPGFSISRLVWLENGGILAVVNLRGGSEYGEEWHTEGMLGKKQNVFDDFISAAEYLIENGYTRPGKLAANGGSNGGLLVTASMLQRPDLFGAVVAQVPVTDMLRYHRFTVGRYWVPEYGNAETDPEHFKFLYAYSPLHNVKAGVAHPPTLITTADTDDRVVPAHAKKFAATLQAADAGVHPILLRVETKAGHGAGKPTAKILEEQADIWAFLFKVLELPEPRAAGRRRGALKQALAGAP